MAEGPRLAALCGLKSHVELAAAVFPGSGPSSAAGIQARLAEEFIKETRRISACLDGAEARFADWQAARFQLENLKITVRALEAGGSAAAAAPRLIPLPREMGYGPELAAADSREALLAALPQGALRSGLGAAYAAGPAAGGIFYYEAALDRAYLGEQAARAGALAGGDAGAVSELCAQEAAAFNLALAAQGKFFHGFKTGGLLPLLAAGPDRERSEKTLRAAGPGELRALAAGLAVAAGPPEPDPDRLAALAWRRYALLAWRAFAREPAGFGAVAAYLALRRVETVNLIAVSEGLRLGAAAGEMLRRLVPLPGMAYV